jgi:L-asparaginase
VDGIVVTHGTDTLEETAFLLDLTLAPERPVVFCGAMRTISEPGWDGPANLTAAVRVAAHPASRGRGVLVAFGGEVHSASEVTKWHTQQLSAFRSPAGPLGTVERDAVRFRRPAAAGRPIPARRIEPRVALLVMAAGCDAAPVHEALRRGARGLVIEATGCGNVPPRVLPGIRAARRAGVPVVIVSRCPEGRVTPTYAYEGGGRQLRDLGAIFAPELPGHKARIKLMVGLGSTTDTEALRELFELEG